MQNILNFLITKEIGEPPWDYYFLQNLDEKEYPMYLSKIFNYRTGEKLPLKYDFKIGNRVIDKNKCKTFNQKIQWIKLYGVTNLMRDCTDKIKVRDYVKEKIGEEYLKPILQIIPNDENILEKGVSTSYKGIKQINNDVSTYFDRINFEKLPNSFVLKCNHGCKWHYIIKEKKFFLNNTKLFQKVRQQITGWLEQSYSIWGGFESQYKEIEPKILIEPLMRNDINKNVEEIQVYSFSGIPKFSLRIEEGTNNKTTLHDSNLNIINRVLSWGDENINKPIDNLVNHSFDLSKKLSENFIFVRIDWMIYQDKLYFEELTFTPYSGFWQFHSKKDNFSFGKLINLERG